MFKRAIFKNSKNGQNYKYLPPAQPATPNMVVPKKIFKQQKPTIRVKTTV
jgi:hypothetical protein